MARTREDTARRGVARRGAPHLRLVGGRVEGEDHARAAPAVEVRAEHPARDGSPFEHLH